MDSGPVPLIDPVTGHTLENPVTHQPISAQIKDTHPDSRSVDLTEYVAGVTLPSRELAQHLFLPNAPLTTASRVKVLFNKHEDPALHTPPPTRWQKFLNFFGFGKTSPRTPLQGSFTFSFMGLLTMLGFANKKKNSDTSSDNEEAPLAPPNNFHRRPPAELARVSFEADYAHEIMSHAAEAAHLTTSISFDPDEYLGQIENTELKSERYWFADQEEEMEFLSGWDWFRAKLGLAKEIRYRDPMALLKEYKRRGAERLASYPQISNTDKTRGRNMPVSSNPFRLVCENFGFSLWPILLLSE